MHRPPHKLPPLPCQQDEDTDEYGPVIPEAALAEAIRDRTEMHLRKLGTTVSGKVCPSCSHPWQTQQQRRLAWAQPRLL